MKLILFAILFLFFSKGSYSQDRAVFYVKDITTKKNLPPLSFYLISNIFEPDVVNEKKVSETIKLTDSTYRVTVSGMKKKMLLHCIGFTSQTKTMLVSPGDSLHVVISDSKPGSKSSHSVFYGPGANNYNSTKVTEGYGYAVKYPDTIKNYQALFKYLKTLQKQRDSLIQTYAVERGNNQMLDVLKKTSHAILLSELKNGLSELNINLQALDIKHLIAEINAVQMYQDEFMLSMLYYVNGMRAALTILNKLENPDNLFTKKMNAINTYYKGGIRSFLLSDAYYRYSINTSGDAQAIIMGNEWYIKNKGKLAQQSYNDYIDFTYTLVNKVKQPWPAAIAKIRLYDKAKNTITLEQLLAKYNGSPIVLDHWATWCGPCIIEFAEGKYVVEQLKNKGLKFIYISIDKTSEFAEMAKLANEYQLESYRVDDKDVEAYKRYLNLTSIPRYVLLNEKGILVNISMPRPSEESAFRQMLNRYIGPPPDRK